MGRPRNENPRLGLTGVVNAEKWQKMDEETRPKLVHMDPMKEPNAEMAKVYDVTAIYSLLDYRYNKRGEVLYEFQWSRELGVFNFNI